MAGSDLFMHHLEHIFPDFSKYQLSAQLF